MRVVARAGVWVIVLCLCPPLESYSVLTHEAIIDSAWDRDITPVLLKRFPQATPEELVAAHGYAYAGCILQDMGYYPNGSRFFSDLIHYLRSGDFVANLIREAQTLDEYAFALGALAHYTADTLGHSVAVNPSVAQEYPKLALKFGNVVSYADDPSAHLKVEFSFDVLQVSRGNYAPQAYHDFIGFYVSREVLAKAFHDTYSLELAEVFPDLDSTMGTFRHAVSSTIPEATRVAWRLKKKELLQLKPGITRKAFVYNLSRASYRRAWDGKYKRARPGSAVLAFVMRILPKVGPLRALAFRAPIPQTERLFEDSFDRTLAEYRRLLTAVSADRLVLENRDLDTGNPTRPTEYVLADKVYGQLAVRLAAKPADQVDSQLRDNVLAYYRDLELPFANKKNRKDWQNTVTALRRLRAEELPAPAGVP